MVWFNHNLISHCSFPNNRIQLLSSGKEEMLLESEEEDFLLESACETARLFVYQISYRRWAPKLATSKKNDSNFTGIIGFPMVFKRKAWWGPRITAKWTLFCQRFSDEESERCRGWGKKATLYHIIPFLFVKGYWNKPCRFYNLSKNERRVVSCVYVKYRRRNKSDAIPRGKLHHACCLFVWCVYVKRTSQDSFPREFLNIVFRESLSREFSKIFHQECSR